MRSLLENDHAGRRAGFRPEVFGEIRVSQRSEIGGTGIGRSAIRTLISVLWSLVFARPHKHSGEDARVPAVETTALLETA
jgi:hypothetical protein